MVKGKERGNVITELLLRCSGSHLVHPPLQGSPDVDGFLVKAAAALADPAVVGQELSPFLHLLQNLLPFLLNLRRRLSFSFSLVTWTNQGLGGLSQRITRTEGYIMRRRG